jgi:hypothetical protein
MRMTVCPLRAPFTDVPQRFADLTQRVAMIDDGPGLAGFDELRQKQEVVPAPLRKWR